MGAFPALRAGNRAFRGSAPLHSLRSAQRTSPSNPLRGNFPRAGGPLYAALPAEIEKTLKTRGRLPYKELIQNLQKLETMMERL
jgi:hypothetical protein